MDDKFLGTLEGEITSTHDNELDRKRFPTPASGESLFCEVLSLKVIDDLGHDVHLAVIPLGISDDLLKYSAT